MKQKTVNMQILWWLITETIRKTYSAGALDIATLVTTDGLGSINWLLSDHLGSTSITVRANGTKSAELRFSAFGETRYTSGTTPTDYRYTGQLQQGAVNLYYYNARWYDPKLGRFTQADTIIPSPADPQSWDRYGYVKNNPVRYSDPSGKRECEGTTSSDCGFMPPKTVTVLKSMFNDYGITLTGNWTVSEGYSAYVAVYKVSDKLKDYSHKGTIATFNHAFGKMEFTISNDLGGWYGLGGDGHISILAGVISVRLVTHELAHAFEKHIFNKNGDIYYGTNNPIQMLAEFGIHDEDGNLVTRHGTRNNGILEPENGYRTDQLPDQYHPISMQGGDYANEDWADMFMNWIFDSFSDTPAGKARYAWVENNMPTWIR